MYTERIFLILFCGSAQIVGLHSSITRNDNQPSHKHEVLKDYDIAEIEKFSFAPSRTHQSNDNTIPHIEDKSVGFSPNVTYREQTNSLKKFGNHADSIFRHQPKTNDLPASFVRSNVKDIFRKSDSEDLSRIFKQIGKYVFKKSGLMDNEDSGGSINEDLYKFLIDLGELNEILEQGKYVDAYRKVKSLTKDIDLLTIAGEGMVVRSITQSRLTKGIQLVTNGKNILVNGKIMNYIYGKNDKRRTDRNINRRKYDIGNMWVRFLKKLGKMNTMFEQDKYLQLREEIEKLTKGISALTVNDNNIIIRGDVIKRLTKGIQLTASSQSVIANGKILSYEADGLSFRAGGPAYYKGKKISESSEKIRSIQIMNEDLIINGIPIKEGEFYDFK